MKKATLSIALLTLTLVLTSFSTPETLITSDASASQAGGTIRKEDVKIEDASLTQAATIYSEAPIDGRGSQSGGVVRKED